MSSLVSTAMKCRSLSRNNEFQKVYREGVKQVGRLLVVYLLPAVDDAQSVVASRKVGGAVQRNRAKRLLREALANGTCGRPGWVDMVLNECFPRIDPETGGEVPDQGGKAGLWIVLVARRRILTADSRQVQEELGRLLESMTEELSAGERRS
jgi:ribonuclease P protein component